jgi:hypothetical protein
MRYVVPVLAACVILATDIPRLTQAVLALGVLNALLWATSGIGEADVNA